MTDIKIPTMLTIKETAQKTKISEFFIRQLAISGKIVCVKAGKKYLINLEKFVEFLNTGLTEDDETKQEKYQNNKFGIKAIAV